MKRTIIKSRMLVVLSILALSACTSVEVMPLESITQIKKICIKQNPDVKVSDFLDTLRDGLDRHGIATDIFNGDPPAKCEYILIYTATRNWDFAPYMDHAELRIYRDGRRLAYAEYTNHGGFTFTKYASTKEKIDPVIDELLKNK